VETVGVPGISTTNAPAGSRNALQVSAAKAGVRNNATSTAPNKHRISISLFIMRPHFTLGRDPCQQAHDPYFTVTALVINYIHDY
jgi:hypothetical protein